MKPMMMHLVIWFGLWTCHATAAANEPAWRGPVIARGEVREQIEATPILERPYRPLHFYGNTVRRRHYRGQAAPAPRDVLQGTAAAVRRE